MTDEVAGGGICRTGKWRSRTRANVLYCIRRKTLMCTTCNCFKHKSNDICYTAFTVIHIKNIRKWYNDHSTSCVPVFYLVYVTVSVWVTQGTKAKPSIGANKHTSQHRNGVSSAAGAPGTDAAADALAAVGVNCSSSSSSSELSACWLGCSATVWAPTAWLTARRNCDVSYAPLC